MVRVVLVDRCLIVVVFILRSCSASMIYTYLLIYSLSRNANIKSKYLQEELKEKPNFAQ